MASEIVLGVRVDSARAVADLKSIEGSLTKLKTPLVVNVDTKGAVRGLKDLNTIASNFEKTIRNAGASTNVIDRAIQSSESASKSFSNALRQQMQAEQELEKSHKGLASSYNVIDQAIRANESAGKAFSDQLRQQMQAEQELERENKKLGQSASEAADGWSVLGGAISTALGSLASRAVHLALSKITQGIREALSEMKKVDTQLTNISKVSGIAGKALADMGERAYETASKYGVAADEYLSSVYTFQKAGLGESAETMGELAVKTMLVGDTTADVASQFLISANAAWKYGGNIEKLNQLVDEADYINNNYATDLTKLSSGLPRVASVAAQAGMSAEETLAALGTITAVTQESGTKAATALRALILNIEGQVGEFVDDTGETFKVTEESVKSMEGLMNKYAKAELEAAKASGELINPMTAIKAIFEGMANSDLNDQELFQLLSGMGGKLRTNQLTALVQNYELFDEMLGKIANSAGTADSEIALMMESWERKTQVLKNTWTEFVTNFVSSDTIKGAIDDLTSVINFLDETLFYDKSELTQKKYDALKKEYDALVSKGEDLNGIERERLKYLDDYLAKLKEIADEQKRTEAERWQNQGHSQDTLLYESFTTGWQDATKAFGLGDISSGEYIAALRDVVNESRDYYENLQKCKETGVEINDFQQQWASEWEAVNRIVEAGNVTLDDTNETFYSIVDAQGNVLAGVEKYSKMLADANEEQARQQQAENDTNAANLQKLAQYANVFGDAQAENTAEAGNTADAVNEISFASAIAGADALTAALEAAAYASAGIAVGPIGTFGGVGGRSGGGRSGGAHARASGTTYAPGGPTLVNELGPELISENGRAYIANGGRPGIVNLSRGAIVLPASVTQQALKGSGPAMSIHAAAGENGRAWLASSVSNIKNVTNDVARVSAPATGLVGSITTAATKAVSTAVNNATQKIQKYLNRSGSGSGGGGGGGGSVSVPEKSVEELAKELKDLLANLDKQAKLADNQKDYEKEADLYGQAQDAIDQMVADYRKAGYSDTSDEILDLLNKRYDYESKQETASEKFIKEAAKEFSDKLGNLDKQAKLANLNGDYDKEIKFYEKAQDAIGDMIDTYRAAGYSETSNEILDLLSKQYDYQSKIEAAAKKPQEEAEKAFKEAVQQMNDRLGNLDKQARIANLEGNYAKEAQLYEQAQEAIKDMVDFYRAAGYEDTSDEILALLSQNYDYANKQLSLYQTKWDELTKALKEDTDTQKQANVLAEKQQAVEEAREALANAQNQRTVRMYNAATGQWEWVADSKAVTSAEKALTTAETAYSDEVKSQTLSQAFKELEDMRNNVADLNNVVLGPALSSVLKMAESSNEFQNFARALNAVYGVGSYLSTTEGSSNVISTADSHDTVYTFGNITLTEEQASSMSVAELAQKLQVLKIS